MGLCDAKNIADRRYREQTLGAGAAVRGAVTGYTLFSRIRDQAQAGCGEQDAVCLFALFPAVRGRAGAHFRRARERFSARLKSLRFGAAPC